MNGVFKQFVAVYVYFDIAGNIKPLKIEWPDGRIFEVDKVLDMRQAASLKAGGQGIRYTCRIGDKSAYLFYEAPRWFVEAKYS